MRIFVKIEIREILMDKNYRFHWAWVILGVSFVNLFINYSARLGYSVVLPEMIRDLGFSRTEVGSIFNSYLFTYIILTPLSGFFTDRFGARRVISLCALILGIGVFMMGLVNGLLVACIFYAIAGMGATGMWTPIITVVQRWFSVNKRGLALGIISTGYGLGFACMGLLFPLIVHNFNWRYFWFFLGSSAMIMFLINAVFLRSTPEDSGYRPWGEQEEKKKKYNTTNKNHIRIFDIFPLLTQKTFWLIGLSYFSISYSLYGITTFMVDYAQYQLGIPLEKASLLATIHGSCQIIGVISILPLSDYLGRKRTIIISNSFIAGTLIGIIFCGSSWSLLSILIGIMAVFYGVTFPLYGACAGDYFPKEFMGTIIGAWTPFYGAGAILVHWVNGMLRDITGVYNEAFILNAGASVIAILLIASIKKQNVYVERGVENQQ